MTSKTATLQFIFRGLKAWFRKMMLFVTVSFLLPFFAFSNAQPEPRQYYDAGSIIIAGEGQEFVISAGESIKLSAGQSILLLPGTRIEAGGRVVVEVNVKVKPETTEERSSVLLNPEMLASPYIQNIESTFNPLPESEKLSIGSRVLSAVIPAPVSHAGKQFPVNKIYFKDIYSNSGIAGILTNSNIRVLAWGERPETIKVLRT